MCPLVQELAGREGVESLCCVDSPFLKKFFDIKKKFQISDRKNLSMLFRLI